MLLQDRSKTQYLAVNTGAPFAQMRAYNSARAGMDGYGLRGLGLDVSNLISEANQFNPEPISRSALQTIQSIEQFFRIGVGRQEADRIVPIQNQIHYDVLKPIAEAVNAPYKDALSQSQLMEMLNALLTTKDYWLNFLHNTQWSDGRAAVQAEQTLAFLFDDQERKLRELLVNAPYFSTITPPEVIPVGGGHTNGTGRTSQTGGIYIPRTTGFPSLTNLSSLLPWGLLAVGLMYMSKAGKYR